MRKVATLLTSLAAIALAPAAMAQDDQGDLQIKVMGTAVLPDGKITSVNTDAVGLPANTQTSANDNFVPTIAIEYFVTPELSIETICCMTQHDVDGTTGLPGAELVADAKLIPATATLKYHLDAGGIRPYIGAGVTYFLFVDDEPGAAAVALGVDDFKLDDSFGAVLQAGVDVPLNDTGMVFSLDAKRYFVSTDAHWFVGGTEVIGTTHKLDPWVLSAGIGLRF